MRYDWLVALTAERKRESEGSQKEKSQIERESYATDPPPCQALPPAPCLHRPETLEVGPSNNTLIGGVCESIGRVYLRPWPQQQQLVKCDHDNKAALRT